ncbi:Selenocysteine lyase/Cysteine desulfurase [Catalinimonas alkaloidigena]|uniref:Selenocysteine lyase/Cysteine desulfurase n=1 Tax=Catalinimonas alkaloidigena TaxID=1075417 RepID=A0A1G9R358_9BACT|nr:aminotransferase class V-fold PLP-dependent enzyme [Catalinimonas alkaloidigena]SDM17297.1 Selenocysteine lyase/Cysteine desulfurase [Catalinimonas alkaloidigena]
MQRRNFLTRLAGTAGLLTTGGMTSVLQARNLHEGLARLRDQPPLDAVRDEEAWNRVRQAYTVSRTVINLNNGGVSPQPLVVQDAVDRFYRYSNEAPSYYMWRVLDMGREPLRRQLADFAGCSPDELAIHRNTTEALATAIFGIPLKKGDEVVLTKQDYPNMINAWKQRELRDGIKLVWINLALPSDNEAALAKSYTDAFTNKTKVVHVTHMINWTGQVLPAARICEEARQRGILSVVDGAHTFAHIDYRIPDLKPDYFGTSLHKWMCAPFGTGLLYVKKDKINDLWPLFGTNDPKSDDIRKFESLGTRSFANEQAIAQALDFHLAIGGELKEQRLRYLKDYWAEQVKDLPRVRFNTPLHPDFSCALANVTIDGLDPNEFGNRLFNEYKIHTTTVNWEQIHGVRVTPHVYTSLRDLDLLVEAIKKMAT